MTVSVVVGIASASYRFDSVAKRSEFPDHFCRMALLGLFRHCRAAFFIPNAVMENYPDQVTEAMRNYADCIFEIVYRRLVPRLIHNKTLPLRLTAAFAA